MFREPVNIQIKHLKVTCIEKHCSVVSESSFILTALVHQWVPELVTFPWKLLWRSLAEERVRDLSIGATHLIASFGVEHLNASLFKLWQNMVLKLHPQRIQLVVAPKKSWCLMLCVCCCERRMCINSSDDSTPCHMLCEWCCDQCGTELDPYRSLPCAKLVAVDGLVRRPFGRPGSFQHLAVRLLL